MQVSVPSKWIDWLNVEVVGPIRRVDVIVAFFAVAAVGWGWYSAGWRGACIAAMGYALMMMYALWSRPYED